MAAPSSAPTSGCVVHCRSHRWLVEKVEPAEHPEGDTVVRLACLDDDANGQRLEVFWEREVDGRVLGETTWDTVGQRGFDDPQVFGSYLNTLRWNGVTSTDPGLFQAPLRAGIDVKPYQLEPLRKALRMPRVSLFIADDVGLGKTIEAALILRQLLLLELGDIADAEELKAVRRQVADNWCYWQQRLASIDTDLEREPERIRRTFALQTHRVEPAGAIYLWPQA